MSSTNHSWRRIRSFVRRDGRMTEAQRRVMQASWFSVKLDLSAGKIDYAKAFGRIAPIILEIGFGSGYSLLEIAKANPQYDFIGIETYQPGIASLLLGMEAQQVSNLRIYYADAVAVLDCCIPASSLAGVQIFFPDPWPKRRHHKRRLIQPAFVEMVTDKLKPQGIFHLATDWEDYALQMMAVLSQSDRLQNVVGLGQYAKRSTQRPVVTKFEQRGTSSGYQIWELQFACLK